MLLDVSAVLGGIGLAIAGFVVVVAVCVVILRMLAAILPAYDQEKAAGSVQAEPQDEGLHTDA